MILALTAFAGLATSEPAFARWSKAETQNFVIYSEGSEKSLRDFAEKLQRFDATLRFRFKVGDALEPNRLPIYLVNRTEDAGRLATGRGGSSIAGFYAPANEGSFAVAAREDAADPGKGTSQAQQILFHEYAHHFMKRYVPAALPAWFVEGFAEYYSTVDFTKDFRADIGKPVYSRAYGLLAMPKVPADRLLFQRPSEMRGSGQADVYYGRAWLLTHMLYNYAPRDGQLSAYVKALNDGVDPKEAATRHFGDLAQLDKDVDRYLKGRLAYRTTNDPIAIPGDIRITPLSPADDAILPWRLERISATGEDERLAKVQAGLTKLTAAHSGDAGPWFELAATHWAMTMEKRNAAAARVAVDRALAIDPKHVRANVLLGQIIAAELDAKGDFSAASWRKVRGPISLANRTNPDDPLPLYAYFSSFVEQGVNPPDMAFAGLARAFELAPENITVRVTHAFALANKGEFDRALRLAKTVAFDPHDRGQGQGLLDQIEKMKLAAAPRDAVGKATADDAS